MDFAADEPRVILSKSVTMIERTIDRLDQVDELQFPTSSSTHARDLLLNSLKTLLEPANLEPMAPAVLYNKLFSLQELAETVCRSSTDRISWPLVSYCDDMWKGLFRADGPSLFYSLTSKHNYTIFRFSDRIKSCLDVLLPKSRVASLLDGHELYCLELPSSEDANLPLYANIGHEFGHAVFDHHRTELLKILMERIRPLLKAANEDLQEEPDPSQATRRFRHVPTVLMKLGTELFCDLVGARLMGASIPSVPV